MAELTAWEQLSLELVNRARLNPAAEAARFGIDLNQNLAAGTISAESRSVLAPDVSLQAAAKNHSLQMLAVNQLAHEGIGDATPYERISVQGYILKSAWMAGENIAWGGTTEAFDQTTEVLKQHQDLILNDNYRLNICRFGFKDIGVGIAAGDFNVDGTTYKSILSTQTFGNSLFVPLYVTGVTYRDISGDDFYSVGEGRSYALVQLFKSGTELGRSMSQTAGGYSIALEALNYAMKANVELVFSGGGLVGSHGVQFLSPSSNAKVDMVDDNWIETDQSAIITRNTQNLRLLGNAGLAGTGNALANTLIGNDGSNQLLGKGGNDWISGGNGWDNLVGGRGNDTLVGGQGNDRLSGGTGYDTYSYGNKSELGDLINDFDINDSFSFDSSEFGNLPTGVLKAKYFWSSPKGRAHDANDRFVYSANSDTLYFDPDGNGGAAKTEIAHITHDFNLTAADILIV